MAITTRARSRDEKRERRHEILGATAALFLETPYDRVTMAEVARRCGLAKGTLYLYFRTKEELFLALAERDLELFFAEVNGRIGHTTPPGPEPHDPVAADVLGAEALATLLVDAALRRESFTRFLSMLHLIFEQNVGAKVALAFKRFLLAHVLETGTLLDAARPSLGEGGGATLLLRTHAFLIGLTQMASPSKVVERVLRRPEMGVFVIDLRKELFESILALIHHTNPRRNS